VRLSSNTKRGVIDAIDLGCHWRGGESRQKESDWGETGRVVRLVRGGCPWKM